MNEEKYAVFISHADADKVEYVDDLVTEIRTLGIDVFYDKDGNNMGGQSEGTD